MTRRPSAVGLLAILACAGTLAACSNSTPPPPSPTAHFSPSVPAAVPLAVAAKLAHPVRIGLIVTTASQRGEGGDDIGLAAGARVAEFRLGLAAPGKATLDVADDHGNGVGSLAAVRSLLADGVVGIVYASEGNHMRQGLTAAKAAGLPVLLPYAASVPVSSSATYVTGPSQAQEVAAIAAELSARKLTDTYVLTSGSAQPDVTSLAPAGQQVVLEPGTALSGQVAGVAKRIAADPRVDSVAIFGPAATQAEVIADLQQQAVALPILLGEQALSDTFSRQLVTLQSKGAASSGGTFTTVGVDPGDNATASSDQAFLAGLRLATSDGSLLGLESTETFSADGAATAETRSHDAVVALAVAAATATATDPAAVATALSGLTVTPADGLAGPPLHFSSSEAVAPGDIVALQASQQATGQRAGAREAPVALTWFAVPGANG